MLARAAAAEYEALYGEFAYHTIITWSLVASILDTGGDCPGAVELARQVDERMQATLGERNQAALIERGNLAFKELDCGDRERGFALLAAAESGLRRHFGESNVAANSFRYALARELTDTGRHAEALGLLESVDAGAMTAAESSTGWSDRLLALRGQVLVRLGRVEEGVALVRPALARLAQDPAESEFLSRFADLFDP